MDKKTQKTIRQSVKCYSREFKYVCIPTAKDDKGKPKKAIVKEWQTLSATNYRTFKQTNFHGVGIVTGQVSNLTVVDIDVLKAGSDLKNGFKWLNKWRKARQDSYANRQNAFRRHAFVFQLHR